MLEINRLSFQPRHLLADLREDAVFSTHFGSVLGGVNGDGIEDVGHAANGPGILAGALGLAVDGEEPDTDLAVKKFYPAALERRRTQALFSACGSCGKRAPQPASG